MNNVTHINGIALDSIKAKVAVYNKIPVALDPFPRHFRAHFGEISQLVNCIQNAVGDLFGRLGAYLYKMIRCNIPKL